MLVVGGGQFHGVFVITFNDIVRANDKYNLCQLSW